MKNEKELLEYYGKCCVSEYTLDRSNYPSSKEGERYSQQDAMKLENIRGQKLAIEYIIK